MVLKKTVTPGQSRSRQTDVSGGKGDGDRWLGDILTSGSSQFHFLKCKSSFLFLFMKVKVRLAPSFFKFQRCSQIAVKDYFTLRFLAVRQAWQSVACIQPSELLTEGQAPTNYSLHSLHSAGERQRGVSNNSQPG